MTHASPEGPQGPAPRAESLAKIAAMTALLRAHHVHPPDAFVWTRRTESRWWAFGRFGRYSVETPRRYGWAVGDFPWEGAVHDQSGISSEVFVKPTFVDAEGRIAPLAATRASPLDNHLLTDEMCEEIAERMEQVAAEFVPLPSDPPVRHSQ